MMDNSLLPAEYNAFLRPGTAFVLRDSFGFYRLFRHPSEHYLHASRAKWHPEGGHCPRWTDECRCMLGGEA